MFKYFDEVLSTLGEPVTPVVVTVFTYPALVPVIVYEDDEVTPKTVTTNSEGEYSFNVDAGVYTIVHTYNGAVIETRTKVSIGYVTASRTPAPQTVVSAATVTPTFSNDIVTVTALAVPCQFLNPTGTAIPNLGMVLRVKDNGVARALTWDTQYRASGAALPTTTTAGKTMYIPMTYNADDTKWDVAAASVEV